MLASKSHTTVMPSGSINQYKKRTQQNKNFVAFKVNVCYNIITRPLTDGLPAVGSNYPVTAIINKIIIPMCFNKTDFL